MDSMKMQQFGIKFPFTCDAIENYFLDTNMSVKDKIRSIVTHVIFTPKGQKLRDPNFGTRLIEYIFENNDDETWDGVRSEISRAVSDNVPGVNLYNVEVLQTDGEVSAAYVKIQYSVEQGFSSFNDELIISI